MIMTWTILKRVTEVCIGETFAKPQALSHVRARELETRVNLKPVSPFLSNIIISVSDMLKQPPAKSQAV